MNTAENLYSSDWSLSVSHLEHWRGERCLFQDLSFSTKKPVLHLRGSNGSGKTSLLKVICFLSLPERGEIGWRQQDRLLGRSEVLPHIAYAGHQDALNPELSVLENLSWASSLHRALTNTDISNALVEHGQQRLAHLPAASLSAGQRRRMALIRTVLSGCPVWVWDEPYANLDTQGRDWVDGLMLKHIDNGGLVIVSAHQKPAISDQHLQTLELDK